MAKMEPISSLAKIENPPSHPMTLFKEYLGEAEKYLNETYVLFNLATCNLKGEALNRTLVLRGHDDDGIVLVTERNSRKFQDIQENPNVCATFLWCYQKKENDLMTKHQVRIMGVAQELAPDEIRKYYETEPTHYKIRSSICRCGASVEWEDLKARHDKALKEFLEEKKLPKQNDSYTVIHIKAKTVDFYHCEGHHQIADRVVYHLDDQEKWRYEHVYA